MSVLISICIPAYKKPDHIKRLMDSISIQTFRDFEVIITDDSPDLSVQVLCETYPCNYALTYFRNEQPLGTPENWNEAIRRASGQWIKIMHDDDWFSDAQSLEYFAGAAAGHPETVFIFSAYRNIRLHQEGDPELGPDEAAEEVFIDPARYRSLLKDPVTLISGNSIGPPSVVMHKRSPALLYDNKIRWLVDIDFYIRILEGTRPVYIDRIAVNVGLGDQQVTRESFRRRTVEIPENFYLLNKLGTGCLKNIKVYDAWWRLMRNLEIRNKADITGSGYTGEIPAAVLSMIGRQRSLPRSLLRNGFFSKSFMLLSYIFNFNKIEK